METGSLSRAAESLHVAQPALSKQIAQLENDLGVRLLSRSVRGVKPTESGLAVYQHAKVILKQVEATYSLATAAGGHITGNVAVGLPWTLSTMLGLALLKSVSKKLPGVRLELTEGPSSALSQSVSQGKLDLAIVFAGGPEAGLNLQPLVTERLCLIGAAGSLGALGSCTVADLVNYPLVLLSRPNAIREMLERIWDERGLRATVFAEINAPLIGVAAVREGLAFSVLPACVINEGSHLGKLDFAELTEPDLSRTVCLATSVELPVSAAAERVKSLLEELVFEAVNDGGWDATILAQKPVLSR